MRDVSVERGRVHRTGTSGAQIGFELPNLPIPELRKLIDILANKILELGDPGTIGRFLLSLRRRLAREGSLPSVLDPRSNLRESREWVRLTRGSMTESKGVTDE